MSESAVSHRVLLLDPDVDHAMLIARALAGFGAAVDHFTGVDDAVAWLEGGAHPAVELVIVEPGRDVLEGLGALRRVRSTGAARDARAVVFSNSDWPRDRVLALAANADDFVTKPICAASFRDAVRRIGERWLATAAPLAAPALAPA